MLFSDTSTVITVSVAFKGLLVLVFLFSFSVLATAKPCKLLYWYNWGGNKEGCAMSSTSLMPGREQITIAQRESIRLVLPCESGSSDGQLAAGCLASSPFVS